MTKRIVDWPVVPLVCLLLLSILLFIPSPLWAQDTPPTEEAAARLLQTGNTPIPPFVPGTVLVGLRVDMTAASVESAAVPMWGELEVLAVEPLDLRTGDVGAAGESSAPLTGYKLTVPVGSEWQTIETLSARSDVAFAEPDWLAQIAQIEPDKAVAEKPFVVTDSLYPEQWYIQRIGMSRAWSLAMAETGGNLETVDVFVIDTGVDFSHPDLASKVAVGRNYLNSLATAHDDNGHGTHVSGLIAAAANGAGIVGPGLQVKIVPFKALNAYGLGGVSGIGQAIRDAANEGADIINLSLELSIDTQVLRSAIQYAVNRGVLIVAAAGNQGNVLVSYPAAYPSVLAVGATGYYDERAYYSNRGSELDLMAPGGLAAHSILSSWTSDVGASCPSGLREENGGIYCEADGTSMATGLVSGVAALVMSLRPDLDAYAVQQILLESAAPLEGEAADIGHGRMDAAQAIRMAIEPRLILPEMPVAVTARTGESAFVVTIPLENPSLQPLTLQVTPTITTTWYTLAGPVQGEASYGDPLEVQLVVSPSAVHQGLYETTLRVTATDSGGGASIYFVDVRLNVFPTVVGQSRMYIVWVGAPAGSFQWVMPSSLGRTNFAIGDDSSIVVDLPFTMTVNGQAYTDLRVYADGFVVGPGNATLPHLPNHCLANQVWPPLAIYGWWSDLRLVADSALSVFQPDANRFAIEYSRFALAGSANPNDRVSFQIVLHRNGEVNLNYIEVPEHAPADLTIGVSADDGRFYNQIACHVAGVTQVGEFPRASQSFYIPPKELY